MTPLVTAQEIKAKFAIPNPCTSCHTRKPNGWAKKELLSWNTTSPWRVGQ
jgi:hypothetical protein